MKRRLDFTARMGQVVLRPAAITAMGLMVLLLSTAVFADPTPSGTVYMQYIGIPGVDTPGASMGPLTLSSSTVSVTVSNSYPTPSGLATFEGYVNGGFSPVITIGGYATDNGLSSNGSGSKGEVTLDYYYRVSSSAAFVPMKVSFAAMDNMNQTGSTILDSVGTVGIGGIGGAWFQYISNASTPLTGGSSIDGSGTLLGSHTASGSVQSNVWYQVHMDLWDAMIANTNYIAGGSQNAGTVANYAVIEPTITIDPTWLAANPDSQLEFATLQPVPIPGALLLFAPGLAGLAAIRRRFKK